MSAGGLLYLLASLAFVGILYLLADAQCHLRMSERDYGDFLDSDSRTASLRNQIINEGD
jgi:hypothetical protein